MCPKLRSWFRIGFDLPGNKALDRDAIELLIGGRARIGGANGKHVAEHLTFLMSAFCFP